MLVFSEQRLIPAVGNILTLEVADGFLYVHSTLYREAVILDDRYPDLESLRDMIKSTKNENEVRFYYETAPKPVNSLAIFLSLCNAPKLMDIETCTGYIYAMSRIINFREFPKQDIALRRSVSMVIDPEDSYLLQWGQIKKEWFRYEEIENLIKRDTVEINSKDSLRGTVLSLLKEMKEIGEIFSTTQSYYPNLYANTQNSTSPSGADEQSSNPSVKLSVDEDGTEWLEIEEDEGDEDLGELMGMFDDEDENEEEKEEIKVVKDEESTQSIPVKSGLHLLSRLGKKG